MKSIRLRMRRWYAIARLEILHLIRDPSSLSLIVMVPAVQVVLFGYAVNLNPRNVPIAIARETAEPEGTLRRAIAEVGYFHVIGDGLAPGEAWRLVVQRQAMIGIELPPPTDAPNPNVSTAVRVIIDASDPAAVRPAALALESQLWRHRSSTPRLNTASPVRVEWLYNPQGLTSWAIAPALAGVIVMISMLMLGALTLVRERERGTWEGLICAPVSGLDAMLGKLTPYVLLGIGQAGIVWAISHWLFDMPIRGKLVPLGLATALLALAHLVTGFSLSALARTQLQAIQAAVFFYLPSILLSGFMFPFTGMPRWAMWLGETLPLTHFIRAARGVLLRGERGDYVALEMWPVAVFTVLVGALAMFVYRRRLE
jgi:ABC-2 type transport system permease protein